MRSFTPQATVLFVVALAYTMTAQAQERPEAGPEKEARAHYRQGIELYEAGQFDQAAVAFGRAYELRPSFKILWNLAQSENELGHYAAAHGAYTRYIEEGGEEVPADRRAEAEAELERLATLIGSVLVEGGSEGASLFVDGKKHGVIPLDGPLLLDLGERELVVRGLQGEIYREVVRVAGGKTIRVRVAESWDPLEVSNAEPGTSDKPEKRLWTWVALGVAGAAGITGGILGGVALARKSDIESHCQEGVCPLAYQDDAAGVERLALGADILYGVAAAGAIAAVVMFFVEPRRSRGSERQVVAGPALWPGKAGLTISGRF
jgi:hypothetical protein